MYKRHDIFNSKDYTIIDNGIISFEIKGNEAINIHEYAKGS